MAHFLYRVGRFTARRHFVVLGVWVVLLVIVGFLIRELGANTSNNLELPGTDSQAASDLLADRFPPQQNGANPIVFHATEGKVTDQPREQAIKDARAGIRALPHVDTAPSPFGKRSATQISDDGETAFIPVLLTIGNEELTEELAQRYLDAAEPASRADLEVAAAGQIGSELSEPSTENSDKIGIAVAMVILAFTFGTFVAMGLPIVSAALGLIVGLSLIGLLGHVTEVPSIAPTLATMIGLGVGIDYALFLVMRYRRELDDGLDVENAVATAVATSGTAIVFAGSTVVLALITLLVAGIPLVTSLGYASAVAVITAVAAAITLLPAILSLLGRRIDRWPVPGVRQKPAGAGGIWERWARFVVAHPGRCVLIALGIMLPLIIPFLSLDLGQEDIGATPKDTTERQAYDLLSTGFGPGYNGPLLVAVELGTPARPSQKFLKQDRQAKRLQSKLEDEQSQGQAEAAKLQAQGAELQGTQAALEGEQAALEGEAAGLSAQRADIEASRAALDQQRNLRAQLNAIVSEAGQIAREDATLAAQETGVRAALGAVRAEQARIQAELAGPLSPGRRARLERRLASLQAREAELVNRLAGLASERQRLAERSRALAASAAALRAEAAGLGGEAVALAAEAEAAVQEAVALEQQKDFLQSQAASAQIQAANLEAQKAGLEATQKVANYQEKDAKTLKHELTRELTSAGGDERGTDPRLVQLQRGLKGTIGVDVVSPPQINDSGDAAVFTVIATTAPAEPATADLVETVRDYVIPQRLAGTDADAHVGGQTASYVDLAAGITARLGLVIVAVVALGFIVLMTAFRSVVIPAQAAVANVLSVAAAFGVVTACFQFGWGLGLVGVETVSDSDPIASFVPLIMFAVLFGLSMDYQVFLMSQIEQARARTESDSEAIAVGLAAGARVITAAALIMMAVFASFILNGDPTVKQFGVGLSVGVALAAMSVLLLAPAILVLAKARSWWVPRWADRLLPHLDIEGAGAQADSQSAIREPSSAPASS